LPQRALDLPTAPDPGGEQRRQPGYALCIGSAYRIGEEAFVTIGPADGRAARPGRLRASHVDREQVISALKTAFVQGRLAKDEFDARVGQALAARTHAELAAITADIPADPISVRPVQPIRPVLGVKSGACVTALAAVLATVLWAAAAAGSAAAGVAALAVSGVVIFTLSVTGYQMRESRHPGRSARPLPPGTAS
jgi:hypothetical protein